jgi:hypothetical protein
MQKSDACPVRSSKSGPDLDGAVDGEILLYLPRIPNAALCMNFRDPSNGTIDEIAGMIRSCKAGSIDRISGFGRILPC